MTGMFRFLGDRPMNLRGRDGLVYSFNPGDTTKELAQVVVKFPRLFIPIDKIVETPAEADNLLAEVIPETPVVESNGAGVEGDSEVLTEVEPDKPTLESDLPTGDEEPEKEKPVAPELLTEGDPTHLSPSVLSGDLTPDPANVTLPGEPVIQDGLSEELPMNILRELGKELGVKTGRISKKDLIASIREARKNANP